jgi:hypothetical protein
MTILDRPAGVTPFSSIGWNSCTMLKTARTPSHGVDWVWPRTSRK